MRAPARWTLPLDIGTDRHRRIANREIHPGIDMVKTGRKAPDPMQGGVIKPVAVLRHLIPFDNEIAPRRNILRACAQKLHHRPVLYDWGGKPPPAITDQINAIAADRQGINTAHRRPVQRHNLIPAGRTYIDHRAIAIDHPVSHPVARGTHPRKAQPPAIR